MVGISSLYNSTRMVKHYTSTLVTMVKHYTFTQVAMVKHHLYSGCRCETLHLYSGCHGETPPVLTALMESPKSIFRRPMALMMAMMDWMVLL